ncbi:Phytepsin [Hordeum vulgare]|nr:Phytepsin [Hordeum vulgare]
MPPFIAAGPKPRRPRLHALASPQIRDPGGQIATMGTRGLTLALFATALLLQTLLSAASEAEGLVRIALKKRPIDRNSRAATGLSRSEEQSLLTGVNTLSSEEGGDILSLKNFCFQDY